MYYLRTRKFLFSFSQPALELLNSVFFVPQGNISCNINTLDLAVKVYKIKID